jgi:hypothetical protein
LSNRRPNERVPTKTVNVSGETTSFNDCLLIPACIALFVKNDTFKAVEKLTGPVFDDTLTGDTNDNVLQGGAGLNKLRDAAAMTDTASCCR